MPHICVSEQDQHCFSNGLSPIRRQAITWTNAVLLSIRPLGTNFNEIWIKIQNFSFMKIHFKMSSAKWRSFCSGGNDLSYHDSHLSSWDSKLWHILIFLGQLLLSKSRSPEPSAADPGADPEHEKKYLRIFSMSIPRSPFGNVASPYKTDSWPAPSQWETSLQSNAVSHWLGANLESALPLQLLGPKRHSEYSLIPRYMGVKRRHLTHGGLSEMVVILQITFSNVCLSMKMFKCF